MALPCPRKVQSKKNLWTWPLIKVQGVPAKTRTRLGSANPPPCWAPRNSRRWLSPRLRTRPRAKAPRLQGRRGGVDGAEAAGPKKGARQFSKIWGIPRDAVSTSDSDRQVCVLLPHPKLAGVFLVSCLTTIHSLERRQRPHGLTRLKPKQFPLLANPPPHFLSASPPVQLRRQAKHPRNSQSSSRPEPGEASLALIRKRRETLEARGFG